MCELFTLILELERRDCKIDGGGILQVNDCGGPQMPTPGSIL